MKVLSVFTLRIQWRLIFAIVIRYYRLRLHLFIDYHFTFTFTYQKALLNTLVLLIFKIVRSLQCILKVGLSPSKKNCVICFTESPLKMMKNAFYFILKALFVLKIFKFLSWLFGNVEKTAWLEIWGEFRNLWRHSLVNKELQYTYCSISHELKATGEWNFVS